MKKIAMIISTIAILLSITISIHANEIVTEGLVSYWTFDRQHINGETIKDLQGYNDATRVGNPKMVSGLVYGALRFDGVDDYVNLTNLGDFGREIETSTFEIWVKTDFDKDWSTLFKVIDPECGMAWGMDINRGLKRHAPPIPGLEPRREICKGNYEFKKDRILIHTGTYRKQGNFEERRYSVSGRKFHVANQEWNHIVFINGLESKDESGNKVRERGLYLNGEKRWLVRTPDLEPEIFQPFVDPIYLGAGNNQGVTEGYFTGMIDEVRIYNRALTEEEVLQNMEYAMTFSVEPKGKLSTIWGMLKKNR